MHKEPLREYFSWDTDKEFDLFTLHNKTVLFRLPRNADEPVRSGLGRFSVDQKEGDSGKFSVNIVHTALVEGGVGLTLDTHFRISKALVKLVSLGVPANGYDYVLDACHVTVEA